MRAADSATSCISRPAVRGMMPGSSGEPCMVCVLPAPVTPYAKTVVWRPSSVGGSAGATSRSNSASCGTSWS